MTLVEIMAQIVLPSLVAVSAGGAGGFALSRHKASSKRSHSEPPQTSLPPPRVPRSEQAPEWMRESWTAEKAAREIAEATAQAAEIENRRDARERITALERANSNHQTELRIIGHEMGEIRAATQRNTDVLSTVRDAVLTMRSRCPQCEDSDPAPVVRGGAAARGAANDTPSCCASFARWATTS